MEVEIIVDGPAYTAMTSARGGDDDKHSDKPRLLASTAAIALGRLVDSESAASTNFLQPQAIAVAMSASTPS
jgi:hypothetical protein